MGILFSTIDLEVVGNQVFSVDALQYAITAGYSTKGKFVKETLLPGGSGKWKTEMRVIGKGGYKWYLGEDGILLMQDGNDSALSAPKPYRLIAFDEPLGEVPVYIQRQVDLSTNTAGQSAVLFKVAGRVIQLK